MFINNQKHGGAKSNKSKRKIKLRKKNMVNKSMNIISDSFDNTV